jgi:nucleotide-binding universal stress UspA family protein
VLRDWAGTDDEQARLRDEERTRSNVVVSGRPVLLASLGGPSSIFAAQVLDLAWPTDAAVTIAAPNRSCTTTVSDVLAGRSLRALVRPVACPLETLLHAARQGHGTMIMGLPDGPVSGWPDQPSVALRLAAEAPIPVVLVRKERRTGLPIPPAIGSILVPVTGRLSSRAAQEVAFGLSARIGSVVNLAHVVTRSTERAAPSAAVRNAVVADGLMRRAQRLAQSWGATTGAVTRVGDPAVQLLALSVELDVDLVVVGVQRSAESADSLFLGHVVEELLDECPATVIVVVNPPGWSGA